MKYVVKTILLIALLVPVMGQAQEVKVKDVNVSVEEKDGYKKITIKKTLEDGTIDIINWEGKGGIPEDIKKELGPGGGIIIHEVGDEEGMIFIGGDSTKMIKKTIEVIVDEHGETLHESHDKKFEVIIKQEGENVIHLDKDAEVIIIKEGEDINTNDDVKVWIQKVGEGEKEVKVMVNKVEGNEADEKHVIIIKDDGKTEKIITTKDGNTELGNTPKIERSLRLKDFQVSPNPADGQVNLSFKGKKAPITLRLIDAAGREVYKERISNFDGNYQNQIDVEGISTNLLFISIEQKGKVYTDKIALKR